jgi:methionine aminopeptidase
VYTTDSSMSAHFEHTVAITESGPRILTPVAAGLSRVPGGSLAT